MEVIPARVVRKWDFTKYPCTYSEYFNNKELRLTKNRITIELMVDGIEDVTENTGKIIFVDVRHFSGKYVLEWKLWLKYV